MNMTLSIGATPYSQWQNLETHVESLGWLPVDQRIVESWYQQETASKGEDCKTLLLHSRPEYAIAQAMELGEAPETTLNSWLTAARSLLNHYRRNRRNTVLIDVKSLSANTQEGMQTIAALLGSEYCVQPKVSTDWHTPRIEYLLLATQLVQQTEGITDLLDMLEACSQPLQPGGYIAPSIDIGALFQDFTCWQHGLSQLTKGQKQLEKAENALTSTQTKNLQLTEALQAAEDENALIIQQLHPLQEALETSQQQRLTDLTTLEASQAKACTLENELEQALTTTRSIEAAHDAAIAATQKLQRQQAVVESALTSTQATIVELTEARQAAEDENALIIQQLHQLQQELESLLIERKRLQQADSQYLQINQELEKLKSSATWKVTAPLRAIAKPFKNPTPEQKNLKNLKNQIKLIKSSALFDRNWYLKSYPDVAAIGVDPIKHYLKFGASEGRDPSARFSTNGYFVLNPEVKESSVNPLIHHIMRTKNQLLLPHKR